MISKFLVESYRFLEKNFGLSEHFIQILLGNAIALGHVACNQLVFSESKSSVTAPTQSMSGVVLGSCVPYMSIATFRRSSRGKPKDLCKWWSQAEGQGWHFVAMGKRQLFLLGRDESPSVVSLKGPWSFHGWHPVFLILW